MNFSIQSLYTWYRNLLRNPTYRWWVILGTLVYILSPIDIIPDVFPIVGQIDDVVIFSLLVSELSGLAIASLKTRKSSPDVSTETVDVDAVSMK
ncbi:MULTISPECIES: YkvA family protein [unclassified Anabaena]|uniref:YkvA family protein n=1 Tax=unclassified Anabaena TaxID=2619674 RepID=UPI0039C5E916